MNQLNQFDSCVEKKPSTWREKYEAYLLSDHWKDLRAHAINRAKHSCEACKTKRGLVGHHMVYREPLESCTLDDIMSLCGECHDVFHAWVKQSTRTISSFSREETVRLLKSIPPLGGANPPPVRKVPNPEGLMDLSAAELECFNYHFSRAPKGGAKAMRNYALKRVQKQFGRNLKHLRSGSKKQPKNPSDSKATMDRVTREFRLELRINTLEDRVKALEAIIAKMNTPF